MRSVNCGVMQSFMCMARAKIEPRSQGNKGGRCVYAALLERQTGHLSRLASTHPNSISRTTFPSPFFYAYIGVGCNLLLLSCSQACGEEPTFILFIKLRVFDGRRGQWTRLCQAKAASIE